MQNSCYKRAKYKYKLIYITFIEEELKKTQFFNKVISFIIYLYINIIIIIINCFIDLFKQNIVRTCITFAISSLNFAFNEN